MRRERVRRRMDKGVLPPMPPSDMGALDKNHYDHFYNRSSRSIWKGNEINYIKDEPMKRCKHKFEAKGINFECSNCNFGMMASVGLRAVDGKLFYRDTEITFKT